jgi:signal transduction histidine kinase
LLAAFALHRMRTAQLLQLERVRTRIATNLHDDIGASLSRMAILSEVIARRAGGSDSALVQNYATKIAVIARELIDSMSDIVWTINSAKETLADLEQRMREFAGEMLLPRNIGLDFETAPAGYQRPVSIEARREMLLIFKEAIHNVVRHSGCTRTRVPLEYRDGRLLLEVRDNGRGFDGRPAEGNGIGKMRRRADAIRAHLEFRAVQGEGAILKLAVPLSGA